VGGKIGISFTTLSTGFSFCQQWKSLDGLYEFESDKNRQLHLLRKMTQVHFETASGWQGDYF
jgi:hypothetical protein